jgi:uncharacterized protein
MAIKVKFNKSTLHGDGIFATTTIYEGEVIEVCPIIILNEKDTKEIDKTHLYNYYFAWEKGSAISLGYGSIYNHSYEPNARYEKDFPNKRIIFKSIAKIKKDEEITINYNGDPNNKERIWFEKQK